MSLSIDDLFTANNGIQAEALARCAEDIPCILPEPGEVSSGEYLFAIRTWRFEYDRLRFITGERVLVAGLIEFIEKMTVTFEKVLDNLDTILNHSAVRICIFDKTIKLLPPEVLEQYPERSFYCDTDKFPVEHKGIWVVFSADVQFNSIQSLIRTIYSLDNCFALTGIDYPADNKKEWNKQFGEFTYRKVDDTYSRSFDTLKALHQMTTNSLGCVVYETRQNLMKDLMKLYTDFNHFVPSLRAYNYLCERLNTDLSHGMFNYSIQLKTKQILQHITELSMNFYIKNKFDYCTIDVHKAMNKNRHRCFFTTDDIGLNIASNHTILDFDDVDDGTAQTLKEYFENNEYKMKSNGSLFAIAEAREENVDYLLSIFRIGALEYPNVLYYQDSPRLSSPTTIKETGFTVCTKLSNPDTAFDRHFELLRELILDEGIIEYSEIKYNIKNWYTTQNLKSKDYMWK